MTLAEHLTVDMKTALDEGSEEGEPDQASQDTPLPPEQCDCGYNAIYHVYGEGWRMYLCEDCYEKTPNPKKFCKVEKWSADWRYVEMARPINYSP